jgi:hypothetical protein
MQSAAYHRAQAELYRHIAQILSRSDDAEVVRAAADRHDARAEQLEATDDQEPKRNMR